MQSLKPTFNNGASFLLNRGLDIQAHIGFLRNNALLPVCDSLAQPLLKNCAVESVEAFIARKKLLTLFVREFS